MFGFLLTVKARVSGIGISIAVDIFVCAIFHPSQPRLYVDFSLKYNRIYSQVLLRFIKVLKSVTKAKLLVMTNFTPNKADYRDNYD